MSKTKPTSPPPAWRKPLLEHGGIIIGFLIILAIYFKPVWEGQVINQSDILGYKGMAKELIDYREANNGKEALWTNSMFGGMPAYQISVRYYNNVIRYLDKAFTFGLPRPVNYIFLMFLGFYFMLVLLDVNPYLSGLGAMAFALSSYFFVIMEAGHTSKANAIAYMAPIVAGILLTYRGKYLVGAAITALFLALEINANHYQMTYYLGLVVLILGIVYLVDAIQQKTLPNFAKATGILFLALFLAIGPNIGRMWTTYEYGSVTMRGPSELTTDDIGNDGLDREYALRYSYGITETLTLLVPNLYGGASQTSLDRESEVYKELRKNFGQQGTNIARGFPTYWGDQPPTSGPVYVGAIVCFLFILGLLWVPGKLKWWVVAATALTVMLSWGRHFGGLTDLFFYYFPYYNKFRAVSQLLVIAEFTMPFLGVLALSKLINGDTGLDNAQIKKHIYIAAGITGGLALLLGVLGPSLFAFEGRADESFAGQPQILLDLIRQQRVSMLQADAFRSAGFIAAAAALVWLFVQGTVKKGWLYAGLGVLLLLDMLPVDRRYVNDENFVTPRQQERFFQPSQADQAILQDKDPNYRVLNLTSNTFNDSRTSYYHKSIGGYHAAKLRRYSDIITRNIQYEMQEIIAFFQRENQVITDSTLQLMLARQDVLNMLNMKYVIVNPEGQPLPNQNRLGNAWFVSNIKWVENPDEEIEALNSFDPSQTAIVDKRYEGQLAGFQAGQDSAASISLTSYQPNELAYKSSSSVEQLAVFSEIYYNNKKGWNAYLDGKLVPHARANYVLRTMLIPAGEHEIVFKFEPESYRNGETISLIASILLMLFVGGAFFLNWRSSGNTEEEEEAA